MGEFLRDNLPDPASYFSEEGLVLSGPRSAKWKTTRCDFHGGSDSIRVNTETGTFICMAGCGARGGDVLAYHMAAHGLGFVEAARALGAYRDDDKSHKGSTRPTPIAARLLLKLAAEELMVGAIVMSDCLAGRITDADFDRFRDAAGRVIYVAEVANA